jgi:type IV pilus assembly protein PilA
MPCPGNSLAVRSSRQPGFTLLEFQLVLLLVSLLLMISIPIYLDYKVRTKVGAGLSMVGPAKSAIVEYYWINNKFPENNAEAGLEAGHMYNSNYLLRMDVLKDPAGAILLTFDNIKLPALGANNTIIFKAVKVGGTFVWDCRFGTMKNKYRPKNCYVVAP